MTTWLRRVWHLLNRRRHERELVREMNDHRQAMHDPSAFGDTHRLLERSRDEWGWNWLDDAMQDLRLGLRSLWRAPAFAATGTLILAFGIGLNVTLCQLVAVVLLNPPALKDPETLARLTRKAPNSSTSNVPYPLAQALAEDRSVLAAVMVEVEAPVVWGPDSNPVMARFVSPNWFLELGSAVAAGRLFGAGIDGAASDPVAVVSHHFWQSQLGGDPATVGSTLDINRKPVTIVGVSSPGFTGTDLNASDIWLVIDQREYWFPDSAFLRDWKAEGVDLYVRFKDGVGPEAVRERARALMASWHQERPDAIAAGEWLEPAMANANFMDSRSRIEMLGVLSLLGGLTTLVLIVAATNVGNLVLSRATGRSRELGVRVALGANRSRIVRQLMVETAPLVAFGAAGGMLMAALAVKAMSVVGELPDVAVTPGWPLLAVCLWLGGVALLVIGAVPAWKVARQDLNAAIKDGGQQVSLNLDKARLRRFMMAAQVCGSCVVLVLTAMMTRTLQRVLSSDLGFKYEQAAVLQPGLGRYGYDGERASAYWSAVRSRIEQHPAVASTALALAPPLGGRVSETRFDDAPGLEVIVNHIDPSFFDVMQIPLITGRTFERGDDPLATVVVSRALALAMYDSIDVVGRGFPVSAPRSTIVGVSGDAHSIRIESSYSSELYRPLRTEDLAQAVLIARSREDAATLAPVLREAAAADNRVLPGVALLKDSYERRVSGTRIAATIASATGLLTLLIACLGIFGVVSYSAALRTKEFGIHIAVGAERRSVLRLVLRPIVWPVSIGVVGGLAGAAPLGMALNEGPIQLRAADPTAYLGALAVFIAASVIAALIPALRVLRANPLDSLRHS